MKDIIRRHFPAIGQGGFYVEEICAIEKDSTCYFFVYDCGTYSRDTGKKHLESFFEDYIKKRERHGEKVNIEILGIFISHFHGDHVNGLDYLITHYRVDNIFIPYIAPEDLLLTATDYIHDSIANGYNLTDGLVFQLLYFISQSHFEQYCKNRYQENGHDYFDNQIPTVYRIAHNDSVPQKLENVIPSNNNLWDKFKIKKTVQFSWIYHTFIFKSKDNSAEFNKRLPQTVTSDKDYINYLEFIKNLNNGNHLKAEKYDLMKIHKLIKKHYKFFCDAYDKVANGRSVNSMTLYSGPEDTCGYIYYYKLGYDFCHLLYNSWLNIRCIVKNRKVGFLYLGDSKIDTYEREDELSLGLQNYWDEIGSLQIPHHGSQYNFKYDLDIRHDSKFRQKLMGGHIVTVISADPNYHYKKKSHPGSKTVRYLCLAQNFVNIVTTDYMSSRCLVISKYPKSVLLDLMRCCSVV